MNQEKEMQYKVIFLGEIVKGFDVNQVKINLALAIRKDVSAVEKYFSGKEFVLVGQTDYETAQKFCSLIELL